MRSCGNNKKLHYCDSVAEENQYTMEKINVESRDHTSAIILVLKPRTIALPRCMVDFIDGTFKN